jgi:hypothetical protein
MDLIVSQLNPIHIFTPGFFKICFNVTVQSIPQFRTFSLPFSSLTKILCAIYSAHDILLDLITPVTFGDECEL